MVANMTSYIPSVTLPGFVFERPALSILLPVLLGTGVGFSVQRETSHVLSQVSTPNVHTSA